MPSLSTALSPELSKQWRDYFHLLDTLRDYAVWRHEEDGEQRANGNQRPPRFVAVVAHPDRFALYQQRAAEFAHLQTKWPIQFHDETWGWGRVQVNNASHAQRLTTGEPTDLGAVAEADQQKAAQVVSLLQAAGHRAEVMDGRLMVTSGPQGLTARAGGGRAFRLHVWSEDGHQLHRLSVGAVVCRGVVRGIEDASSRPRKARADTMQRLVEWGGVTLYSKPAPPTTKKDYGINLVFS